MGYVISDPTFGFYTSKQIDLSAITADQTRVLLLWSTLFPTPEGRNLQLNSMA